MNKILPFLFFSLIMGSLSAQTCTISNSSDDFCTKCAANIDANGVVSGTIMFVEQSAGVSFAYTMPNFCGGDLLVYGAVTFDIMNSAPGWGSYTRDNFPITADAAAYTIVDNCTSPCGLQYKLSNGGRDIVWQNQFAALQVATRDRALLLPVTLKSFEAVAAASGVKLNWVTTAERDNDFYEVEHSTDGINFTRMATISGQTESVEETSYAYIHEKPAGGAHYYRLSQQDFDGTRSNLGIRTVLISQAGRIGIFPNPATAGSELTLNLQANETAQPAQLYAITGNLIAEYSLSPGASTLSLPTNLSAGIYLLRMGDQSTRLLVK